ncbi:MAG: hypothetical protein AUK23_06090 [Deltaproteobacteria bacterium CG2_30_43_15]|nr:MAG: hypothetical protein AUK23_06090 [Deltaproteobacteria bacterium CG2_30_43_15]
MLGKVRNQINLIKYYHKYRKGRDGDFTALSGERLALMESLAKEVVSIHERDLEILRGKLFSVEGRAAGKTNPHL